MTCSNPLMPVMGTIIEVVDETSNIKTFRIRLNDEEAMKQFAFKPGQVGQLSMFGAGESTFVINSSPTRMDYLQFSVMRVGEVTSRLHQLKVGDQVGVRAPLGNSFPVEAMKGKDVVFIGGGIGMAPCVHCWSTCWTTARTTGTSHCSTAHAPPRTWPFRRTSMTGPSART